MNHREISIDELMPGMFISRVFTSDAVLDHSFQNFQTRNTSDIDRLKRAGIKRLVIDINKRYEPQKLTDKPQPITPFRDELVNAKSIISEAKRALESFINSTMQNAPVEIATLTPVVNKIFESIKRNNQALLALMHMNRHGSLLMSHSISVMSLASAIGHRLNYSDTELETIGISAMLHDIGWIRMPVYLISKSRKFSAKEQVLVNQLPQHGLQLLKKVNNIPSEIFDIINEHYNYHQDAKPNQAKPHNSISTMARIISIVNTYDLLVHGLMGTTGRTPSAALKYLYVEAQKGFIDEQILIHLVKLLGVYPITSAVQLDTGEKGIVLELNKHTPLQPKVKLYYNAQKKPIYSPPILDLSKQENDHNSKIDHILDPSQSNVDPLGLLRCNESTFNI